MELDGLAEDIAGESSDRNLDNIDEITIFNQNSQFQTIDEQRESPFVGEINR